MMDKLVPVFCLIIAGALFFGYINPTVTGKISAIHDEISKYDSALAAADRFKEKQAQLTLQRNQLPPEALERLDAYLPDGVDNVQLILDLDALASRSGIKLSNFQTTESGKAKKTEGATQGEVQPMVIESGNPIDSVDVSMTASGSYAALRTFMDGVETSLRPLDLVEFSLADSPTGSYNYQMTYRLYWLR